jgi:hypothetical protein
MSSVLYYSNYCEHSKSLLQKLSTSHIKKDIHFLCVDNRIQRNGKNYIQLQNGKLIVIPPAVQRVPSLILINQGYSIMEGEDIQNHLVRREKEIMGFSQMEGERGREKASRPDANINELTTFSMGDFGTLQSDTYSFLDQKPEDYLAEGNGGMRQIRNYVPIDGKTTIDTPPDTYEPDKVKPQTLEEYQKQRNIDVPLPQKPMS